MKFWNDDFVVELKPIERYLFIYLLTNNLTEICGAYEINIRQIVFDTGIEKDEVLKFLDNFEKEEKVFYRNGWIFIQNFIKHQTQSPKIKAGIEKLLIGCPDWIKEKVSIAYPTLSIGYQYGIDTLSNGIDTSSHITQLNSNSNSTTTQSNPPVGGNGVGVVGEQKKELSGGRVSKFSETERRNYALSQPGINFPDAWLNKSEDGRFDTSIEKWLKSQKVVMVNGAGSTTNCGACKQYVLHPTEVRPCRAHQRKLFDEWIMRRDSKKDGST